MAIYETTTVHNSEVKKDLELVEKGQLSDDEITSMWNKVKELSCL